MPPQELKIATIVGARPQFVKAAMVTSAINRYNQQKHNIKLKEIIVHTGQHYDYNMSCIFFDELKIPEPHYHLAIGSGSHGRMTGAMLTAIEELLIAEQPDWVVVYGDTNSTLAGALAAAKLHIPVAHVEAGLRSFNKRMPEEINRVLSDHVAHLLFTPTETAVSNLSAEGITNGVVKVGDVMLDAYLAHKSVAINKSGILSDLKLESAKYCLATVHRAENTDDGKRLAGIFHALDVIGCKNHKVILPLHPRTRKMLAERGIDSGTLSGIQVIEPIGYLDMIQLEVHANLVFTDSGGVQKEAYFAGVPCVTLRDETEWIETVKAGVNFLAGANTDAIFQAYEKALRVDVKLAEGLYGDSHAAERIVHTLVSFNHNNNQTGLMR